MKRKVLIFAAFLLGVISYFSASAMSLGLNTKTDLTKIAYDNRPVLSKTLATNDDYVTIIPSNPGDRFSIFSIEGELLKEVMIDVDKRISTVGLKKGNHYYIRSEFLQLKLIIL